MASTYTGSKQIVTLIYTSSTQPTASYSTGSSYGYDDNTVLTGSAYWNTDSSSLFVFDGDNWQEFISGPGGSGTSGTSGNDGLAGSSGTSGDAGSSGTSGNDGSTGPAGGDGVSADQGGANVDGNLSSIANSTGMFVVALPDSVEAFIGNDGTGLQDITGTGGVTLNATNTEVVSSDSFTRDSATTVGVEKNADVLTWSNIWTARNNVGAGSRLTGWARIGINGSLQTLGQYYNYTRGNQGSQDTFGGSWHPWYIGIMTDTDTITVDARRITGGEAGGTDRTQPSTTGIFALNLDTLSGGDTPTTQVIIVM